MRSKATNRKFSVVIGTVLPYSLRAKKARELRKSAGNQRDMCAPHDNTSHILPHSETSVNSKLQQGTRPQLIALTLSPCLMSKYTSAFRPRISSVPMCSRGATRSQLTICYDGPLRGIYSGQQVQNSSDHKGE